MNPETFSNHLHEILKGWTSFVDWEKGEKKGQPVSTCILSFISVVSVSLLFVKALTFLDALLRCPMLSRSAIQGRVIALF